MLDIDAMICRMGKISNNLEKHGEEDVPEFNIPLEGLMLTPEQLNAFTGDAHCDRSWFNNKRGLKEPMPWCAKNSITHNERYDCATITMVFRDEEEQIEFKDCRLDKITLAPQLGGLTRVDLTLQLTPGLGRENLLLQGYQRREITISIADAKVALKKKDRQQALPLEATDGAPKPQDDEAQQRDADRQLAEAAKGLAPKKRGRKPKSNGEARAH